jgi:hypothetical protein
VLVGEYDGTTRHDVRREVPIPELVDEASAEGGDSLEVAVARMCEFNGSRYDGVLDEDPARHVNAFWYGLKKLSPWGVWLCRWTTSKWRLLLLPWMSLALLSRVLVW